ncbi:hypothetical protein ABNQ38_28835 [Azospirillum sp. A29]|uniref:hypothetical protein n=1 Tax=Azospirillum sp. A29 TaxID=3160606 RepID=UPI003671874F
MPVALLALLVLLTGQPAGAASAGQSGRPDGNGETTLALPHPPRQGEAAILAVTLGVLTRGQTVEVTTADGEPIGTAAPFGPQRGQGAGTVTIPVPAGALRDGRLTLRLRITASGSPPRPPTAEEVGELRLSVIGPPR